MTSTLIKTSDLEGHKLTPYAPTTVPFTDKDLVLVKGGCHAQVYGCHITKDGDDCGCEDILNYEKFRALLNRLEAAENCVFWLKQKSGLDRYDEEAIEKWRKAAGK